MTTDISQPPSVIRSTSRVLLRVPTIREQGRVVFPGIGPMSDNEFIGLVRDALLRGHRVYVKDLPLGQAATPIVKTDGRASLAVSSEFRQQVKHLRAEKKLKLQRPKYQKKTIQ